MEGLRGGVWVESGGGQRDGRFGGVWVESGGSQLDDGIYHPRRWSSINESPISCSGLFRNALDNTC